MAATGDPETDLAHWIQHGCPLGIREELNPSGIFPAVNERERPAAEAEALQTDIASFSNYASLEEWPEAAREQIDRLVTEGFVEEFGSLEDLAHAVGENPVLSKLALISKQRSDETWKHRLIVDLLRSQVNAHINQGERIILPRVGDAVSDGLQIRRADTGFVEYMVADFADAFFMLPLAEGERKFVAFYAFGRYFLARVLMFGAKSSPTLWGRCAAFLARSAQSLSDDTVTAIQLFVDDTIAQSRGNKQERRIAFAAILLWWSVLGAQVAWKKGGLGPSIDWIGANLRHEAQFIIVSVKADLLSSALTMVKHFLNVNVISTPKLRSLAGKLSFIAGIVPTMRPFIAELWAAIAQSLARDGIAARIRLPRLNRRARPKQTVWKRQVQHGLAWVHTFLAGIDCKLERAFLVDKTKFERYAIWCDASPWGLGAVLVHLQGTSVTVTEYLSSPLFDYELDRFGFQRGDPAGQAVWEALTVVVAARAWRHYWSQSTYTCLEVKSDSLAALGAARRLASPDPKLNAVMQELSLQVAMHGLNIGLISHTPGLANKLPDALSRQFCEPNWQTPLELHGIWQQPIQPRLQSWWIARGGPAHYL